MLAVEAIITIRAKAVLASSLWGSTRPFYLEEEVCDQVLPARALISRNGEPDCEALG